MLFLYVSVGWLLLIFLVCHYGQEGREPGTDHSDENIAIRERNNVRKVTKTVCFCWLVICSLIWAYLKS